MRRVLLISLALLAVLVAWLLFGPTPQEQVPDHSVVVPTVASRPVAQPAAARGTLSTTVADKEDPTSPWTTVPCDLGVELPDEVPVSLFLVNDAGRLSGVLPGSPHFATARGAILHVPVPRDGRPVKVSVDVPGLELANHALSVSAAGCGPVDVVQTATVTGVVEGPQYGGLFEVVACGHIVRPYDGRRFFAEVPAGDPCEVVAGRIEHGLRDLGVPVLIEPEAGSTFDVTLRVPDTQRIPLGIDLQLGQAGAEVLRVRADSPAERAGVMPGTVFTHIDGQPVDAIEAGAVRDLLTGRIGTTVRLTLVDGSTLDVERAVPADEAP